MIDVTNRRQIICKHPDPDEPALIIDDGQTATDYLSYAQQHQMPRTRKLSIFLIPPCQLVIALRRGRIGGTDTLDRLFADAHVLRLHAGKANFHRNERQCDIPDHDRLPSIDTLLDRTDAQAAKRRAAFDFRTVQRHGRIYAIPPSNSSHQDSIPMELRRLLELDMARVCAMENAEQHHLAWCLGRALALRPGLIAADPLEATEPHLTWRDIDFEAGGEGHFTATITIRLFKGSRDPERNVGGPRTYRIEAPRQPELLIFSILHRALAIALRRGLIEGIDTLDELFAWNQARLRIKAEALDKPLFYAASPRGVAALGRPLKTVALVEYFSRWMCHWLHRQNHT